MMTEEKIIELIKEQGMIPLFYNADKATCIALTHALYKAGVRIIEFTNRGAAALENLKAMVAERNATMPDLVLAVGTIRTANEARTFIAAGVDFLISPVFDAEVCDVAYMEKMLWIPGCMTPTEIHAAENAGCKLVKLFPGNVLGPDFVSAIKELFPKMLFMPTGGVEATKENISSWFKAGVVAVGMGSKLISKEVMETHNYTALQSQTEATIAIIQSIKKAQ
ncbi:MAG: bifunctional 4-hydroxy-2-oxoglutarate aldolase/2-dehydro-3-deoxy-phosphogluconate aldolase [Sphingobacteriales bacterium]|nr:MAG: bifunctional 4-hydroxy-2-oxoglutarate aldolase/2-dehydro-3-deoxy-phosphogluconate aldolase [Sphingobacteriales bacterium]